MSHRGGVVILANDASSFLGICCDHFAIVLPPFVSYLDKVVGVYPRFEGLFILRGYSL